MLISFEGTEGCGKSTLVRLLQQKFEAEKIPVIATREPGGSPVAEKIREIILKNEMEPLTELFLYESARAEHFETVIAPALKAQKVVLCDRFIDSTIAYQGFARKLDIDTIKILNKKATNNAIPNLTFFLDLPVKEGLDRAKDKNRFEAEGIKFHEEVRNGFLWLIRNDNENGRWIKVSVKDRKAEDIADEVFAEIKKRNQS